MSSISNEVESEGSSASKNGETKTSYLEKFKMRNVNIRDFKIMLVNGVSKNKKNVYPPSGLKKEDEPLVNSEKATIDCDKTFVSSEIPSENNPKFGVKNEPNQTAAISSTEFENEADEKCSVDENSFELRIDNDEDEDHNQIIESTLNPKLGCDSVHIKGKEKERSCSVSSSENARSSRNPSTNSRENIKIPDTINNNDDSKVNETVTTKSSVVPSSTVESLPTPVSCAFCEKQFPSKNSLKFHVLSHLKSFLKQDKKENSAMLDAEHEEGAVEIVDGDTSSDYACVFCEKSFPNKITLTVHYKVHHQADSQKVLSQSNNRRPLTTSSAVPSDSIRLGDAADVPAVTNIIGSSSASASIQENGGSEDASKQYKCYICDKQFARNSSLMWHIQFHETYMYTKLKKSNSELENVLNPSGVGGGGEFLSSDSDHSLRCQVCGKTYESLSGYRRHLANHGPIDDDEGGPGEKCELCNKHCPTAIGLKRHIISMHKDQLPPSLMSASTVEDIDGADAETSTKEGDDSISSGSTSGEYLCNVCERVFSHRNSLKRHMILIHKEYSDNTQQQHRQPRTTGFKCDSCGKYFSTSSNMRKHASKYCKGPPDAPVNEEEDNNTNTNKQGVDEFTCEFCDRLFCSQRAASIHRSYTHRLNASDGTVNDTATSDIITNDSYVELDDGFFQCTLCDKTFESRKGVVRHIGYHKSGGLTLTDTSTAAVDQDDSDDSVEDDDEESDGFPCPVCGKTFESFRGMRIHANSHREHESKRASTATEIDNDDDDDDDDEDDDDDDDESNSSYECRICSESFRRFRSYKAHLGWHSRRGEEEIMSPRKKSTTFSKSMPTTGKIHQCQHCPRWYNTQQALAGHMKAHQPPKTPTGQSTETPGPLSSGGKTGKTGKTYVCQVCGQQFVTGMGLGGHMKIHAVEGSVVIPAASASSTSVLSTSLLTLEDTMECDMCGKSFMRKQDMAKHMRDHMSGAITKENVDLSLFRCIYCSKSFVGRKSLNTHQTLHEESPLRTEPSSSRTNSTAATLKRPASQSLADASPAKRRHSESTTVGTAASSAQDELIGWDDVPSAHQCHECDRRLATKQSLRRHMEWHARVKAADGAGDDKSSPAEVTEGEMKMPPAVAVVETPFECLYCKKSFPSKQLLVEHTSVHKGAATATTAIVSTTTLGGGPPPIVVNDVEALGEHAVVQCVEGGNEEYFVFEQREGEAYQCSECDETHFDKLQMIVHMAYHVGKRWANGHQRSLIIRADPVMLAPHECLFCDERFVNKTYRSRHVLQRHRDNVLQCDSCKKLFLNKVKLRNHCIRHITDAMYRCKHCLKCFTSKWFLKRHARKKCGSSSSPDKKMTLPSNSKTMSPASSAGSSPPSSPPSQVLADHKCEFCGLLVNDRQAFLGHLQSHVLRYKCENCDFGCENILELESHACIVTTSDEAFGEGGQLEAHRQSPRAAATVLCDVCSELFSSEKDLRSHKRTNHASDK